MPKTEILWPEPKFFFADILLISSYRQVTKRDVVCFLKGHFNLKEIAKI